MSHCVLSSGVIIFFSAIILAPLQRISGSIIPQILLLCQTALGRFGLRRDDRLHLFALVSAMAGPRAKDRPRVVAEVFLLEDRVVPLRLSVLDVVVGAFDCGVDVQVVVLAVRVLADLDRLAELDAANDLTVLVDRIEQTDHRLVRHTHVVRGKPPLLLHLFRVLDDAFRNGVAPIGFIEVARRLLRLEGVADRASLFDFPRCLRQIGLRIPGHDQSALRGLDRVEVLLDLGLVGLDRSVLLPLVLAGLLRSFLVRVGVHGEVRLAVRLDRLRHFQNDVSSRLRAVNDVQDVGAGGCVEQLAVTNAVQSSHVRVTVTVVRIEDVVLGVVLLVEILRDIVELAAADVDVGSAVHELDLVRVLREENRELAAVDRRVLGSEALRDRGGFFLVFLNTVAGHLAQLGPGGHALFSEPRVHTGEVVDVALRFHRVDAFDGLLYDLLGELRMEGLRACVFGDAGFRLRLIEIADPNVRGVDPLLITVGAVTDPDLLTFLVGLVLVRVHLAVDQQLPVALRVGEVAVVNALALGVETTETRNDADGRTVLFEDSAVLVGVVIGCFRVPVLVGEDLLGLILGKEAVVRLVRLPVIVCLVVEHTPQLLQMRVLFKERFLLRG